MSGMTAAPAATGEQYPLRWIALGTLVIMNFVGSWDGAAPVVALPALAHDFGVGIDLAVWFLAVGTLFFAVPMAVCGKIGDLVGHRRMYLVAVACYAVFSFLVATAPSFGWLLVFRGLQGTASSAPYPATMAFVATCFAPDERGRAMAMTSIAGSIAWAAGPALGGLIVQYFSWRLIILAEIPVTLLAFVGVWKFVPSDEGSGRARIDTAGAILLTASGLAVMFGLQSVGRWGWASPEVIGLAGLFIALLVAFFIVESRHSNPFLPLKLFADKRLSAATLYSSLNMMLMFSMVILVSIYLEEAAGVAPVIAGLIVASLSVARVFFEPLAGRVAEVRGARLPCLAGVGLLLAVAIGMAAWVEPTTPGWIILCAVFIFGIGIALGRTPVNAAVTQVLSRGSLGLVLGVFSMLTFMSGAFGQTLFGVLLQPGSAEMAAGVELSASSAFQVFDTAFVALICIVILTGLAGLGLPRLSLSVESQPG
jgi:EmrB/QacA subfamily drug resistance transporter